MNRVCRVTEACDVENYGEFEEMVEKLLERRPTKLVTLCVDMKDIEKAAAKVSFCSFCRIYALITGLFDRSQLVTIRMMKMTGPRSITTTQTT